MSLNDWLKPPTRIFTDWEEANLYARNFYDDLVDRYGKRVHHPDKSKRLTCEEELEGRSEIQKKNVWMIVEGVQGYLFKIATALVDSTILFQGKTFSLKGTTSDPRGLVHEASIQIYRLFAGYNPKKPPLIEKPLVPWLRATAIGTMYKSGNKQFGVIHVPRYIKDGVKSSLKEENEEDASLISIIKNSLEGTIQRRKQEMPPAEIAAAVRLSLTGEYKLISSTDSMRITSPYLKKHDEKPIVLKDPKSEERIEERRLEEEVRETIENLLANLKLGREEIIRMRFGIARPRAYPCKDIGKKLGTSLKFIQGEEKRTLRQLKGPVKRKLHSVLS